MATRPHFSEAETLEQSRVALENVEKQPEIAVEMAELGYDAAVIAVGKGILADTRQTYDHNKKEDDESSAAFAAFVSKREQLKDLYSHHRKKAKVIFRNDSLTAEKLGVLGAYPRAYIRMIEKARRFYTITNEDTDIQSKIARLKISIEDITAGLTLLSELDSSRAEYLREKGESQDATKTKDAAFARLDDWMSEFFAVAKIGLEDRPQLLESLGKLVRN